MNQFVQRAGAQTRPHSRSTFNKKPIALAISLALLASQAVIAAEQSRKDDAAELGEITVTGSRIRQAVGMETPTPVTAISITELQTMAPASISEAMTQLPQFFNSQTAENFGSLSNGFFTSPGGGALNLRNIGSQRTLTLLDGRRVPAASIFGVPDINTFPDQLMARIETVTGGASAAYGTDAISGVVNYILDTKFEGFRASAQFGQSDRGDGANEKYTFAAGHALGDKAHVLFSASHSKQSAINQTGDRDWYQSCGLVQNPANGGAGTSLTNPSLIPACNLRSSVWSIDGVLNPKNANVPGGAYVAGLGEVTFNPGGQAVAYNQGTVYGGNVQSGGSGEDLNNVLNVLLPGSQRSNAFAYVDYDVSDNLNVYMQGIYSKQLLERGGLIGNFGGGTLPGLHAMTIYRDNAFLPASIASYMQTNNIASLQLNRQMSQFDAPLGETNQHSNMGAGTIGFKSTLNTSGFMNGWNVDGYFQYGTTNIDWEQSGGIRQDRVFLAADAVRDANGTIKCRVTVVSGAMPDCVPLDLFGRGAPSAAAVDWITGFDPGVAVTVNPWIASAQTYGAPYSYVGDEAKHRLTKLNQRVAELTTSGNLFEGWAGPVQAAFGANYRRESVDQRVQASQGNPAADPAWFPVWCNDSGAAATFGPQCTPAVLNKQTSTGYRPVGAIGVRGVPAGVATNLVETQFSNVPYIRGAYDIKELFNETVFPLVKDAPFLKSLTFQGAVRYADYEGSGKIWSYKAGLDAQFTDEIRLRGTYSHDVRAGNISDRFDRTGGAANVVDKKTAPAGGPPVNSSTSGYGITIVSGGDPNIRPETGDTITLGLVYRPDWLPGFDMSVDWLRVKLSDAIESFSVQQIVDQCYLNGDQDQCARITRDASSGTDLIVFVNQSKQNINKSMYNGVDFELGYSRPITLFGGSERISARMFGSYLIEQSTTNFFGVKIDNTGSLPAQLFTKKANLSLSYMNGPFSWSVNGRYNNGGFTSSTWNVPPASGAITWVADNHTGGSVYWDTRLGYRIPMGEGELELFGNVQNLFDRDPPLVLLQGIGAQSAGGYDQIGRRYTVGVNLKF